VFNFGQNYVAIEIIATNFELEFLFYNDLDMKRGKSPEKPHIPVLLCRNRMMRKFDQ